MGPLRIGWDAEDDAGVGVWGALGEEGAAEGGKGLNWPTRDALRTEDRDGRLVALFASDWVRRYTEEKNPGVVFKPIG